jgi:hypothetical protein
MNQGFAGLDMGLPQAAESLDLIPRMAAVWSRWCDFEGVEAHAKLFRKEQQAALKAMAEAEAARRALEQTRSEQDRQAAELQAKAQDLETRELRVAERERVLGEREQRWAELTARMRSVA